MKSEELLKQNKSTYDKKTIDDYQNKNWSYVFDEPNQNRISKIIKKTSNLVKRDKALDVAVGSGNVYLQLRNFFKEVHGIDLSLKMALEKNINPDTLFEGNCENMPFKDSEYDYMTAYAMVHHLMDPKLFFEEAYRCLKKGGILYIDGDKNKWMTIIYSRIRHLFSKIKQDGNHDYWQNYHNMAEYAGDGEYHFGGFYKSDILKKLYCTGFRKVFFSYRMTLHGKFHNSFVSKLITRFKIRFLYSHFYVIAIK